ncbi:MAG TPA: ribonucleoside-triphosphate reductase, adenosylcobalamin-dependent [Pseudoneobacillus sp.]|nr:ribonucleoside-triphosphate reductase, adenosylcobalamin-dependent [Pseudoneobacillus sp.]
MDLSNFKVFSQDFLSNYSDFPENMNALGSFVYLRTYSRFLKNDMRREVWKETVKRATEYNLWMELEHCVRNNIPVTKQRRERIKREAIELFEAMYRLDQFLAGRTLWAGDITNEKLKAIGLSQFNCSHVIIDTLEAMSEVFYALMVGTGAGITCRLEHAEMLKPMRAYGFDVVFRDYEFVGVDGLLEDTTLSLSSDKTVATITVGDSKLGWVNSLIKFIEVLTKAIYEKVKVIEFDFNYVRPNGRPLKGFGGTASGPDPLREMFEGVVKVLRNEMDPNQKPLERVRDTEYVRLRPIHILDICNLIGYNVVVGGVRRTAEIYLFSPEDYEVVFSKFLLNGIYNDKQYELLKEIVAYVEENEIPYPAENVKIAFTEYEANGAYYGTGLHHRRMSNNSVAFIEKPKKDYVMFLCKMMQLEGEPGMVNLYEAARRYLKHMGIDHPDHETIVEIARRLGLNPCAEVILTSRGVCNLTTINAKNFVIESPKGYVLDVEGLLKAQARSARAGLRMTLVELELPEWDKTLKVHRLTGCSLTGWQDAMAMVDYSLKDQEKLLARLREVGRNAVRQYASELRIPEPLFVTTVKPEGTLSQVAGGVSSGLHFSHSPWFIRRIRINAKDPLALAVRESGWTINPEVGTPGADYYEQMENARTWVIDFPIKSGSKISKEDVSALEQFEIYRMFQRAYTDMNTSNTITVKPDEWECLFMKIYNNWDEYVGVSFLALDGGTYQLAPYEAISEEQYEKMTSIFKPLRTDLLAAYDKELYSEVLDADDIDCSTGACPIR